MTQLGKYSTDRDNILHFLCTSDWANDSFGDVSSPTGFVHRISNYPSEVHLTNTETTSLIEDQMGVYSIDDTEEFRTSLVGHFLVVENEQGSVSVTEFDSLPDLLAEYHRLENEYGEWAQNDAPPAMEYGVDYSDDNVCFQVDGNDIVHIEREPGTDGMAHIVVFASSHPEAEVLFEGRLNVTARAEL